MTLKHIVSRFFTLLLAVVMVGVFTFDAEARRMGGGKSMGRQSSNVTQREAARTPPAAPTNQAGATAAGAGAAGTAAAAARKPWGAMLGGLAAGLGLAWLANSLGLGPAFANLLLFLLFAQILVHADIVLAFVSAKVEDFKGAVILAFGLEPSLHADNTLAGGVDGEFAQIRGNPLAAQLFCHCGSGAGTTEEVGDKVAFVGGYIYYLLYQSNWLLCRIIDTLI